MNTKQKAAAYDEAIERAKKWYYSPDGDILPTTAKIISEAIFPELKESEDERIRKVIYGWIYSNPSSFFDGGFSKEQMLAWLEKQKVIKTNPILLTESDNERIRKEIIDYFQADFAKEEGIARPDWIAWLEKQKTVVEINPTEFEIRLQSLIGQFQSLPKDDMIDSLSFWLNVVKNDGTYKKEKQSSPILSNSSNTGKVEQKFKVGDWLCHDYDGHRHVGCIKSIKDGQVIFEDGNGMSCEYVEDNYHLWTIQDAKDGDVLFEGYNALIFRKTMEDDDAIWIDAYCGVNSDGDFTVNDEDECWCTITECIPATKEQRDLLFSEMEEAGYEWDAEKKELRKIGCKSAKLSEDDESAIHSILMSLEREEIEDNKIDNTLEKNWLKSLKDRCIPQPKSEWSEEDERWLNAIINDIENERNTIVGKQRVDACDKKITWLKSLRPNIS